MERGPGGEANQLHRPFHMRHSTPDYRRGQGILHLRRRLKQLGEFAIFAYIFYNWNIALQMKQAVMPMMSRLYCPLANKDINTTFVGVQLYINDCAHAM